MKRLARLVRLHERYAKIEQRLYDLRASATEDLAQITELEIELAVVNARIQEHEA